MPDLLLPENTVRTYLGPTLTAVAMQLEASETTAPIAAAGGHHIVRVVEREAGPAPPFEQVRERVGNEYRRRRDETRVRAYLEELRRGAVVEIHAATD